MSVNRSFTAILKDAMDDVIDGLGEEALLWLDDASESAVGQRRALMTRAVRGAWERVGAMLQMNSCQWNYKLTLNDTIVLYSTKTISYR